MLSIRALIVLVAVVGIAPAALAGPPLICHSFAIDAAAPMLPWAASRHWHAPHPAYDVSDLSADTLKLLSPDAPVLVRMENMRRAAIYADRDPAIAGALLGAVLARTKAVSPDPKAAALAWFDAGYLVETYRQLDLVYRHGMRDGEGRTAILPAEAAELDGYVLVRKALALASEERPEIHFAASLITDVAASAHRERAVLAAATNALLAQNLAIFEVQ